MLFRNIVFSALIVGVITGCIYGLYQQLMVNPIIYAAEEFEIGELEISEQDTAQLNSTLPAEENHSHDHDQEAWHPENGAQRIMMTLAANILVAAAFSMILLAAMALHNFKSTRPPVNWRSGFVWGAALLLSVYISPVMLGLRPEIPGTLAQSLSDRQTWWVVCVVFTLIGLVILYYAHSWMKILGPVLIALPHILSIFVSSPQLHGYVNTDPAAVAALDALTTRFSVLTSIGMVIFFLILGGLCGLTSSRMYQQSARTEIV